MRIIPTLNQSASRPLHTQLQVVRLHNLQSPMGQLRPKQSVPKDNQIVVWHRLLWYAHTPAAASQMQLGSKRSRISPQRLRHGS